MTTPCSLHPLGAHIPEETGILVYQKFGAGNEERILEKGYYHLFVAGAGGARTSDAWGNNAAGGTGGVLDCILRFEEDTPVVLRSWSYGAGDGNWCGIHSSSDMTAIATAQCGAKAPSVWDGGAGGSFYGNPAYVVYTRQNSVGINGGSKSYHDSPWGRIGAAIWNYNTEVSIARNGVYGLASDGYIELWRIGNLNQRLLQWICPIISANGVSGIVSSSSRNSANADASLSFNNYYAKDNNWLALNSDPYKDLRYSFAGKVYLTELGVYNTADTDDTTYTIDVQYGDEDIGYHNTGSITLDPGATAKTSVMLSAKVLVTRLSVRALTYNKYAGIQELVPRGYFDKRYMQNFYTFADADHTKWFESSRWGWFYNVSQSTANYIQIPTPFSVSQSPFELGLHFITGNDITSDQALLAPTSVANGWIGIGINGGNMFVSLSNNGSTSNIGNGDTYAVAPNTEYWLRLAYDGTSLYEVDMSTNGKDWTNTYTFNSLEKLPNNFTFFLMRGTGLTQTYKGQLDMARFYIKSSGNSWWIPYIRI